jgi:transposase
MGKVRAHIPKETWLAVKTCYLSGMSTKDIAERFEINMDTVVTRVCKAGWNKLRVLPESVPVERSMVEKVAEILEDDWKSKGSAHRRMMFSKANTALREANLPAPRTWKDAQIADQIARKAAGLDEDENKMTAVVNIGWLQETAGSAITKIEPDTIDADFVREDG